MAWAIGCDRPALVHVPGLGALDVHGVDVVAVAVRGEPLAAARRQVEVGLHLAERAPPPGPRAKAVSPALRWSMKVAVSVAPRRRKSLTFSGSGCSTCLRPSRPSADVAIAGRRDRLLVEPRAAARRRVQIVAWPSRSLSFAQVITSANLSAAPLRCRGRLPSYSAKNRSAPSGAMISSKLNGGFSMIRAPPPTLAMPGRSVHYARDAPERGSNLA